MISFTHSRLYKDIGSKAFFTMATLLMPLLENDKIKVFQNSLALFWVSFSHKKKSERIERKEKKQKPSLGYAQMKLRNRLRGFDVFIVCRHA